MKNSRMIKFCLKDRDLRLSLFRLMCVRSMVSDFLEILKTYVSGASDVAFYLYGIKDEPKLSCCVACSLVEDGGKVNSWFKDMPYELIEKSLSKTGLYCGTKLKVDVVGAMRSNLADEVVFK